MGLAGSLNVCGVRRVGNAENRGRVVKPGRLDPDGQPWQIGSRATVDWIIDGVAVDATVAGAVPPGFEAYAAFEEPDCSPHGPHTDPDLKDLEQRIVEHERAVVSHLRRYGATQWWLGYLDTGVHDVVSRPLSGCPCTSSGTTSSSKQALTPRSPGDLACPT